MFVKIYQDLSDSFDRIPEDELEDNVLNKDPDAEGAIRPDLEMTLRIIARNASDVSAKR